jgi:hypothetical protein
VAIGVRTFGFVTETEEEIFAAMVAEARSTMHPAMHDSPDSVFGQLAAIVASKAAEHAESQQDTYESFSENAEGQALDRVCAYTGTERLGPQKSTVTGLITMAPGSHAAGTIVAHVDGDETALFETVAVANNPSGANAVIAVPMQAMTAGPVRAPAGRLTELVGAPGGVLAITTITDADAGSRVRRRQERGLGAVSPQAGMLATLRNPQLNPGVIDVRVFSNRRLEEDAAGRPGKSVECVILGGDPAVFCPLIFKKLTMGIQSFGAIGPINVFDEEGNEQQVWYSRPIARRLYIRIWGKRGTGYPGEHVVQQTLSDFSDGTMEITASNGGRITGLTPIGGVVYRSYYIAAALTVAGVVGVTNIEFSEDGINWLNADGYLGPREYVGHLGERGVQSADVFVVMVE